jgi:hypothetical protein
LRVTSRGLGDVYKRQGTGTRPRAPARDRTHPHAVNRLSVQVNDTR